VTGYYDPKNPKDAVLEMPTSSAALILALVAGAGVGAIGVYQW
jgi:hypothetical protein